MPRRIAIGRRDERRPSTLVVARETTSGDADDDDGDSGSDAADSVIEGERRRGNFEKYCLKG